MTAYLFPCPRPQGRRNRVYLGDDRVCKAPLNPTFMTLFLCFSLVTASFGWYFLARILCDADVRLTDPFLEFGAQSSNQNPDHHHVMKSRSLHAHGFVATLAILLVCFNLVIVHETEFGSNSRLPRRASANRMWGKSIMWSLCSI